MSSYFPHIKVLCGNIWPFKLFPFHLRILSQTISYYSMKTVTAIDFCNGRVDIDPVGYLEKTTKPSWQPAAGSQRCLPVPDGLVPLFKFVILPLYYWHSGMFSLLCLAHSVVWCGYCVPLKHQNPFSPRRVNADSQRATLDSWFQQIFFALRGNLRPRDPSSQMNIKGLICFKWSSYEEPMKCHLTTSKVMFLPVLNGCTWKPAVIASSWLHTTSPIFLQELSVSQHRIVQLGIGTYLLDSCCCLFPVFCLFFFFFTHI